MTNARIVQAPEARVVDNNPAHGSRRQRGNAAGPLAMARDRSASLRLWRLVAVRIDHRPVLPCRPGGARYTVLLLLARQRERGGRRAATAGAGSGRMARASAGPHAVAYGGCVRTRRASVALPISIPLRRYRMGPSDCGASCRQRAVHFLGRLEVARQNWQALRSLTGGSQGDDLQIAYN